VGNFATLVGQFIPLVGQMLQGALKTRNWTSRDWTTRHHIARVDNAEPDNAAPYSRGGHRGTGQKGNKIIPGDPYRCRQASRTVCCRNVQLMPTLLLKRTKIWQRENGKFVDFNDPSQVLRRPSKKRLRISTNYICCQKLELLAYIFAADSIGLHSLVFT